jgi:predicted DNA-binding transcriptional regulator YafY
MKSNRVLSFLVRLTAGEALNKAREAQRFGVTERSIQRDFDTLRDFFSYQALNGGEVQSLVYSMRYGGYYLEKDADRRLTDKEVLAICKILLESRALIKEEMYPIIDKLSAACASPTGSKAISEYILNEKFHYEELTHKTPLLKTLWRLSFAVKNQQRVVLTYSRLRNHETVERTVEPVGIMFSEFYFYLIAFIKDKGTKDPTVYRVDRINDFRLLEEHFTVPYKDRFEEGEFRKRIQFMYNGPLRQVRFRYTGESIEAVQDRFPTAKVAEEADGSYLVQVEVFGDGVDMWLRSQGDWVERI